LNELPHIFSWTTKREIDIHEKLIHGMTTFIWKCEKGNCSKILREEVLGAQDSLTNIKKALCS
jgi:hypothetical protein